MQRQPPTKSWDLSPDHGVDSQHRTFIVGLCKLRYADKPAAILAQTNGRFEVFMGLMIEQR